MARPLYTLKKSGDVIMSYMSGCPARDSMLTANDIMMGVKRVFSIKSLVTINDVS